jgi:hypothetical protein
MAPITAQGTRADAKGASGTPTTTGTPAKLPGNRSWSEYDDDSEVEEPKSPNSLTSGEEKIRTRTVTAPTTAGIYDTIVVQKPPAFAKSRLVPRTPTKADSQAPQPTAPRKHKERCPYPAVQTENDGCKHAHAQDDSALSILSNILMTANAIRVHSSDVGMKDTLMDLIYRTIKAVDKENQRAEQARMASIEESIETLKAMILIKPNTQQASSKTWAQIAATPQPARCAVVNAARHEKQEKLKQQR